MKIFALCLIVVFGAAFGKTTTFEYVCCILAFMFILCDALMEWWEKFLVGQKQTLGQLSPDEKGIFFYLSSFAYKTISTKRLITVIRLTIYYYYGHLSFTPPSY